MSAPVPRPRSAKRRISFISAAVQRPPRRRGHSSAQCILSAHEETEGTRGVRSGQRAGVPRPREPPDPRTGGGAGLLLRAARRVGHQPPRGRRPVHRRRCDVLEHVDLGEPRRPGGLPRPRAPGAHGEGVHRHGPSRAHADPQDGAAGVHPPARGRARAAHRGAGGRARRGLRGRGRLRPHAGVLPRAHDPHAHGDARSARARPRDVPRPALRPLPRHGQRTPSDARGDARRGVGALRRRPRAAARAGRRARRGPG